MLLTFPFNWKKMLQRMLLAYVIFQFPKVSPGGQISNPVKENQRKEAGLYDIEIPSGLGTACFNLEIILQVKF